MEQPGKATGGFISDDQIESVRYGVEEVEFYFKNQLGVDLTHSDRGILNLFFRDYFQSSEEENQGEPLARTRKDIETTQKQALNLHKTLIELERNPSAIHAMLGVNIESETTISELKNSLSLIEDIAVAAGVNLPKSGRWPEIIPARDLIRNLADFYEGVVRETARSGIYQDRVCDEAYKYTGPFFGLIEAINDFLGFKDYENPNASLGKFIYDCLP